jgi:hypothetical protein
MASSLSPLRAPLGRNPTSKRLADRRGGKIDWLAIAGFRQIDYPRPLQMLFRIKPHGGFRASSQALRTQKPPQRRTHQDHHSPIFDHRFALRQQQILSPDHTPKLSDILPDLGHDEFLAHIAFARIAPDLSHRSPAFDARADDEVFRLAQLNQTCNWRLHMSTTPDRGEVLLHAIGTGGVATLNRPATKLKCLRHIGIDRMRFSSYRGAQPFRQSTVRLHGLALIFSTRLNGHLLAGRQKKGEICAATPSTAARDAIF